MGKEKSSKGLSIFDWLVIAFFIVLMFIPTPEDFVTFGLPVIDAIIPIAYYIIRKKA